MANTTLIQPTEDVMEQNTDEARSMRASFEAAAAQASQNAYVDSMISQCETKLREQNRTHAKTCAEMQKKFDQEKIDMLSDREAVIEKAKADCKEKTWTHFTVNLQLEERLASEQKKTHELKQSMESKEKSYTTEMQKLKNAHAQEIVGLRRQLEVGPNSWLEIHFSGYKSRSLVKRRTAKFAELVTEIRGNAAASTILTFSRKGNPLCDHSKTLKDLGIKDGDNIVVTKAK